MRRSEGSFQPWPLGKWPFSGGVAGHPRPKLCRRVSPPPLLVLVVNWLPGCSPRCGLNSRVGETASWFFPLRQSPRSAPLPPVVPRICLGCATCLATGKTALIDGPRGSPSPVYGKAPMATETNLEAPVKMHTPPFAGASFDFGVSPLIPASG